MSDNTENIQACLSEVPAEALDGVVVIQLANGDVDAVRYAASVPMMTIAGVGLYACIQNGLDDTWAGEAARHMSPEELTMAKALVGRIVLAGMELAKLFGCSENAPEMSIRPGIVN